MQGLLNASVYLKDRQGPEAGLEEAPSGGTRGLSLELINCPAPLSRRERPGLLSHKNVQASLKDLGFSLCLSVLVDLEFL